MVKSEQQIKTDIQAYINQRGGAYGVWYVGISKSAQDRLLNGHSVDEKNDQWIYRTANSSAAARNVEDYFVKTLGTDGSGGGGDENSDMVYAYKKNGRTNP